MFTSRSDEMRGMNTYETSFGSNGRDRKKREGTETVFGRVERSNNDETFEERRTRELK